MRYKKSTKEKLQDNPLPQYASAIKRVKAFLIDMFMINMPILYIITYAIMGSKDSFLDNQLAIFCATMLFGLILSVFFALKGQTPGYKAYDIKLIDTKTQKKPSFARALLRYLCFIISAASLIGLFLVFIRKDGKNLHDILSKTMPINTTLIK